MQKTLHKLLTQLSAYYPDTPFAVQYWTGEKVQYGQGQPAFTLRLHTAAAVKHALRDSSLGFAEEFEAGNIEVEGDLQALLRFQAVPVYNGAQLSLFEKFKFVVSALLTRDTAVGAKKNVAHHYDLGNDFYKLWLDEAMTYTCAYFRTACDTLDQAQRNKHEHLCRKLRLQPGMSLIDIGCGWGAMMFYAAEHYGVTCVGYTLSERQYEWVQAEIVRRGMQGRVSIVLKDYREAEGQFDRFVSIGMFEQVGKPFIPTFFKEVKRLLKPGGSGVLHTIGGRRSLPNNPWIEKYIFPGGYIPTLDEMLNTMNALELNAHDIEDLRLHYGETLDNWAERFEQHAETVAQMYGPAFVRRWRLYLNACAVQFRFGENHLYQIAFVNGRDNSLPRTRAYIYADESEVAYFNLPVPKTQEVSA